MRTLRHFDRLHARFSSSIGIEITHETWVLPTVREFTVELASLLRDAGCRVSGPETGHGGDLASPCYPIESGFSAEQEDTVNLLFTALAPRVIPANEHHGSRRTFASGKVRIHFAGKPRFTKHVLPISSNGSMQMTEFPNEGLAMRCSDRGRPHAKISLIMSATCNSPRWLILFSLGDSVFLADTGVPMIFVQWPLMICALIPVIAIEALVMRKRLVLTYARAFAGAAKALVSTLVGVPLAWAIMLAVEFATLYPIAWAADKWHWRGESPVFYIFYVVGMAWTGPAGNSAWPIALAAACCSFRRFACRFESSRRFYRRSYTELDTVAVDRSCWFAISTRIHCFCSPHCVWIAMGVSQTAVTSNQSLQPTTGRFSEANLSK